MISNKMKVALMGGSTTVGILAVTLFAHAQSYAASTTAAITSAGETTIGMFFTNLPVILGFVVAIILTLWGVRWILSQFHRGGRK
jgi:hypothetical protein